MKEGSIGKYGPIPLWFDATYDVIQISVLAAYGHYGLAGMWFWIMMMIIGVHQMNEISEARREK